MIDINEVIANYYEVLSNVRNELINKIGEIVKQDVEIYDTSEEIDDEYYELPTFFIVNKYSQHDTYSIVEVKKNLDVVGSCWDDGEQYTISLSELGTDTIYDLYVKLTKGN